MGSCSSTHPEGGTVTMFANERSKEDQTLDHMKEQAISAKTEESSQNMNKSVDSPDNKRHKDDETQGDPAVKERRSLPDLPVAVDTAQGQNNFQDLDNTNQYESLKFEDEKNDAELMEQYDNKDITNENWDSKVINGEGSSPIYAESEKKRRKNDIDASKSKEQESSGGDGGKKFENKNEDVKNFEKQEKYDIYKKEKTLYKKYPQLQSTLDSFEFVVSEMRTKKKSDYFGEIRTLISTRVMEPYKECTEPGQRRLMSYHIAKLGFAKALVVYYKAIMKHFDMTFYTGDADDLQESDGIQLLCLLRDVAWNFTMDGGKLSYKLGQAGYLQLLLTDLAGLKDDIDTDNDQIKFAISTAMACLHNCAKVDKNKKFFRMLNATNNLLPFVHSKHVGIKTGAILVLAYIVDEDENVLLLVDDAVFSYIIESMKNAVASKGHKMEGYSTLELMEALIGLAANDKNKELIVEKGGFSPLAELLEFGSRSEKELSSKALWTLAFTKVNKERLKKEPKLLQLLDDFRKSKDASVDGKKMAEGALWVIKDQEETMGLARQGSKEGRRLRRRNSSRLSLKKTPSQDSSNNETPEAVNMMAEIKEEQEVEAGEEENEEDLEVASDHVMISYNWEHQKTMLKVRDHLREAGYNVWMDVDFMGGSTLEAMAQAVEDASIVLICMSEKYKQSNNCRTEAEYAFQQRKDIVPLLMQVGYRADGWLGMILGAKLYFDFTGMFPFSTKMKELIKELGDRGKASSSLSGTYLKPIESVPEVPSKQFDDPTEWKPDKVQSWLKNIGIERGSSKQLKNLDGKQIIFLKKMTQKAPEFFFKYIENNLGFTDLESLMKLWDALDQL